MEQSRLISLFCYGNLLSEEAQREVFGHVLEGTPDTLPGYTAETTLGEDVAMKAVEAPGGNLEGRRYLMTPNEIAQADAYEKGYERVLLTLTSGEQAWVYVDK